MYNGPVQVYVQGPGGAAHPLFPFLVHRGRALLGVLESRVRITGDTTLSTYWSDANGNSVKALRTPYVSKLVVGIVTPEAEAGAHEEDLADETELQVWREVYRSYQSDDDWYFDGRFQVKRMASLTYETPAEEVIRLILREGSDSLEAGEPPPDIDWTEKDDLRQEKEVSSGGITRRVVERVVYEVPSEDPEEPPSSTSFTYSTDRTLPELPEGVVDWKEASRGVALLLIGDEIEVERVVDVTFYRFVFRSDKKILRLLKFQYEEAQEAYQWPDTVTVLEPPGA